MFPWNKDGKQGRQKFRGNLNSKAGVQFRMTQLRDKQKTSEALQGYVNEARHARVYEEQNKRVRNSRKRNSMLQRAGEAALAEADVAGRNSMKHERNLQQDQLLAKQMARMKKDSLTRQREIQRICENDEGLRELNLRLKAAYMNKERSMQIQQKQVARVTAAQQEAVFNEKREQERIAAAREEQKMNALRKKLSLEQARKNNEQIYEKEMRMREDAYNEFMSDKQQVEKLMADIANELRDKEQERITKKERLRTDMNQSLRDRAAQLQRRREEEAAADVASAEYRQLQDIRKKRAEEKAAKAAAAAAKIFNKLKAEAERKQAEDNRIAEAIELLRKEDADRRRDEAERRKREKELRSKQEMMEANEAQKRHKIQMRARQMEEEHKLVSRMMAKFKEDERKEKMEELERQQAKLAYKMNILDQMEEQRVQYERMKQRDEEQRSAVEKERVYREKVVEEARRRLLMQHAAALRDFLPKGVLQKVSDLQLLDTDGDGVISASEARAAQRKLMEFGDIDGDGKLTEDERVRGFRMFKADASKRKAHFTQQPPPPSERSQRQPVKSTRPW